jgi:hypothetical protein
MRRPFWLIDGRLREAAYFLDGMTARPAIDESRHNFSAFLSAFASVFDTIDRTLRDVDGFLPWWDALEEDLLTDATVAYLWTIRNQVVHEGLNPLGSIRRSLPLGTTEALLLGEWLPLSENNARMVCGLRLPESLHRKLGEVAEREGVSINQLISSAVAEKMSALMTEEYLAARAKRASRRKFEAVLAKVPDVEPEESDRALPTSRRPHRKKAG